MATYKYKVSTVEAVQLSYFETDKTIIMSYWMMEGLRDPCSRSRKDTDWMVRKPDESISFMSDEEFRAEFDPTPLPEAL